MSIPIVGRRLTAAEFAAYMEGFQFEDWKPDFIVLHNTSSPTLVQRPNGFTRQHMANLADYYGNEQHWSSGPHLFVDDNGIWLFSPMEKHGTHSPSWNGVSIGIEMLGEYDYEPFNAGRGAKVRDNAVAAVAAILKRLGLPANGTTVRLHKEDPATTHKRCPGANVSKAAFLASVLVAMSAEAKPDGWRILSPDGKELATGIPTGAGGSSLVRAVVESVGASLTVDGETHTITLIAAKKAG